MHCVAVVQICITQTCAAAHCAVLTVKKCSSPSLLETAYTGKTGKSWKNDCSAVLFIHFLFIYTLNLTLMTSLQ